MPTAPTPSIIVDPALANRIDRVEQMRPRELRLDGVHALTRDEVNRILDKISAQGAGSLTAEERLFLSNFVPPDDRKSWVQ